MFDIIKVYNNNSILIMHKKSKKLLKIMCVFTGYPFQSCLRKARNDFLFYPGRSYMIKLELTK